MAQKRKGWYDEEILSIKMTYWERIDILTNGRPHLPVAESEYHKAIFQKEKGHKENLGFFTALAAGKEFPAP